MACTTLPAQPLAMATTQLAQIIRYQVSSSRLENFERHSLRLNWVVVTGKNGNRRLRMRWQDETAETSVSAM